MNFDENYWSKIIEKPDWYMEFVPFADSAYKKLKDGSPERDHFTKTVRHFFETAFDEGRLALADRGPNLDEERQPVNTVVIHHTSSQPGYSLSFMNMTHLLNIYAKYYYQPRDDREKALRGQPIWSGHFRGGKPSFLAYHWLMRMDPVRGKNLKKSAGSQGASRASNGGDGRFERLLDDDQIGWHAGNWDINKRSVAICLDNDYEKQDPADEVLRRLAAHIKKHYPGCKIIGHREARAGTICPGTNFLSAWKPKLLEYLSNGSR